MSPRDLVPADAPTERESVRETQMNGKMDRKTTNDGVQDKAPTNTEMRDDKTGGSMDGSGPPPEMNGTHKVGAIEVKEHGDRKYKVEVGGAPQHEKRLGGGGILNRGKIQNTPNYTMELKNGVDKERRQLTVEDDKGDEKDDRKSGGGNDEATNSKWRQMMPEYRIRKKLEQKNNFKGGKLKLRGAKSRTGKGPGRMGTDSSQSCLEMYFCPEERGTPLGVPTAKDIRKTKS